ncbi:hypothetical protein [Planctomycetes bacterium K23_9]|uniref:Uncharacterized protein n=1 Tax=Stieleria marina TaxID=1930275 RepID=A0A517NTQ8_9BACT|nr:hypothetical protein K239x_24730 [Planctomycetes bacterium K23_9]
MIEHHRIAATLIACSLSFVVGCEPTVESFDAASSIPADSLVDVPPNATQIAITYGSGQHSATFHADANEVNTWVTRLRGLKPELNNNPDSPNWLAGADDVLKPSVIAAERETFVLRMGSPNGFSERLLKFVIVRSSRGGVTTVWHDPDNSLNYLWAVYN